MMRTVVVILGLSFSVFALCTAELFAGDALRVVRRRWRERRLLAHLRDISVLFVHDMDAKAIRLAVSLVHSGASVELTPLVTSGQEGGLRPDVLVADIGSQRYADMVGDRNARIPIRISVPAVAIRPEDSDVTVQELHDIGFDEVLQEPVTTDAIAAAVDRLARRDGGA